MVDIIIPDNFCVNRFIGVPTERGSNFALPLWKPSRL